MSPPVANLVGFFRFTTFQNKLNYNFRLSFDFFIEQFNVLPMARKDLINWDLRQDLMTNKIPTERLLTISSIAVPLITSSSSS